MNIIVLFFILLSSLIGMGPRTQPDLGSSAVSRADETKNEIVKSYALSVQKKAEVYNVLKNHYPTFIQLTTYDPKLPEAALNPDEKQKVISTAPTPETADNIQYTFCSQSGGEVVYYDRLQKKTVALPVGIGCAHSRTP